MQIVKLFKKLDCKIIFDEVQGRHRHKLIDRNDHSERFPTFFSGEDVSGHVELRLNSKSLKHKGIKAELHGIIEKHGKITKTKNFLSLTSDLSPADEITQEKVLFEFNFQNVKMPYESYKGDYASVKYYIKIIIVSTVKNSEYDKEFAVVNPHDSAILEKNDEPIYMQVGMKNKMSLSIYFQHKNYNCRGTLKGFITFNFLNINLKFMEVQIVRREVIFGEKKCEPAYVARYELIDGVPNKHEKIPVRFFLKSYNLTPTYPNVDNFFFVKYYLNLVIADDEDNRYFKQKEICLFRLYKERKNVYNINKHINNYNYMNEYGEFNDNDEIFITEPIYEEDFYLEHKPVQNYEEQKNNNMYNKNDEFYDDLNGINQILPSNNDNDNDRNDRNNNVPNSQEIKRQELINDNYSLMLMYNNYTNSNIDIKNNYDDFENMDNNNNKSTNINNNINNNNKFNNNQYNQNKNNINYNKNKSNNNKGKNEIKINNNPSNYHSIKTKDSQNSYDENNMFEEDMNFENQNNNNINNYNKPNTYNKYSDDYDENNINDENDINPKPIENKKEIHHSHRSNLMQARISSEDDFNDMMNSLDTNKNKDDFKKNIFG